jgi:atypical dual specificity phosphatase
MLDLAIITQKLLVGTQIRTGEDLDTLRSLGVTGILSLQEDADHAGSGTRKDVIDRLATERQMELRRCPIVDFDPADLLAKLDRVMGILSDLLADNRRVYVHCTAGINRSTGVVLAYLVLRQGMTVDGAYRLIKSRRPQANPYQALLQTLANRGRAETPRE